MLSKYVSPGDRIEMKKHLRNSDSSDKAQNKYLYSRVNELLSEDTVEIMMPMEQTKLILLPLEQELDVYFQTKNGLYQCYATVKNRYKTNNIYLLSLELTSSLKKHQRREFYRYGCAIEAKSRLMEEEEIKAAEKNERIQIPDLPFQKSIIADISGGGARFLTASFYEQGSMLYCKCNLEIGGKLKEFLMQAEVMYAKKLENKDGIYEHRVQFQNMPTNEREEIIRYIFEEERKNRQREHG